MAFPAKFKGKCATCGEPIEVGQMIRWVDVDESRKVEHVQCDPDSPFGLRAGERTCATCWLVKTNACGEPDCGLGVPS